MGLLVNMSTSNEEQKWLESVKKKLKNYISSPKWDCIILPSSQYEIISQIMETKNVADLPILINERITDFILENIKTKFKEINLSKGI